MDIKLQINSLCVTWLNINALKTCSLTVKNSEGLYISQKRISYNERKESFLFKIAFYVFGSTTLWQIPSFSTFFKKLLSKQYLKVMMNLNFKAD